MLFICPLVGSICAHGLRIPSVAYLPKVLQYRALAAPLLVRIKLVDVDLHNQIKRNDNSIGSNIAEGATRKCGAGLIFCFAKGSPDPLRRDRPKVKADRYRVAKREAEEAGMNWESAGASGYLTMKEVEPLLQLLDEIARMLGGLIRRFDPHNTARRKDVDGKVSPSPHPIPKPPPSS